MSQDARMRTKMLRVRLTDAEWARMERIAEARELTASQLVRELLKAEEARMGAVLPKPKRKSGK